MRERFDKKKTLTDVLDFKIILLIVLCRKKTLQITLSKTVVDCVFFS